MPKELSDHYTHVSSTYVSAYEICRRQEKSIMRKRDQVLTTSEEAVLDTQLIHIRVLGHLFSVGLPDVAQTHVAKSIIACKDGNQRLQVGKFYVDHFIRLFRKNKGRLPDSSSRHQSRPSFNTTAEMIKALLVTSPLNHQQAKNSALIRDNFRCMLSGAVDIGSMRKSEELKKLVQTNSLEITDTQCCHIFAESTNSGLDDGAKRNYAANAWAIIEKFGYVEIRKELEGENIHSLKNILTLSGTLHNQFDLLQLWLEETNIANCYRIRMAQEDERELLKLPEYIKFHSQRDLPLPSPRYLSLHAACCRLAHMSGAADHLDRLDNDDDPFSFAVSDSNHFAARLAERLYSVAAPIVESVGA